MFVDFFIRRPVFATVCSLLLVLGGAVAIPTLPVAQYPQLAPPQVTASAFYTGANAQVVESAVTTPLEQSINGVEGMKYIQSSSGSDGASNVTVTFDVSRNVDLAAVDVQNRVNQALGRYLTDLNTPPRGAICPSDHVPLTPVSAGGPQPHDRGERRDRWWLASRPAGTARRIWRGPGDGAHRGVLWMYARDQPRPAHRCADGRAAPRGDHRGGI